MPASVRRTVEEIVEKLALEGGRRTASREAIVECLVRSRGHLTAEDVAAKVRRRFPSVNLSTVYRTLDALEELGVIDHVHLGHGRAIYHFTDDDHHHLVCERCEAVEEIPARKLKSFMRSIEREHGFRVDRRHFAIVGLCRSCRQPPKSAGSHASSPSR